MQRSFLFVLPVALLLTTLALAQDKAPPPDPQPPAENKSPDIAPPEEIEIPEPSKQPAQPDNGSEKNGERRGLGRIGNGERLRIRAPYTDVELDGGERPRIGVFTPWADVRIDGSNGVLVRTPIGPIHISPDRLEDFDGELDFRGGRLGAPPRARIENGPRPVLGIDVKDDEGIRVSAVREGGPADAANLAVGDRIVSLNGNRYANSNSFIAAIGRMQPGDEVKVRIDRGGQHYQATAKLAAQEEVLKVPTLEPPPRAEPTPADPATEPVENELP